MRNEETIPIAKLGRGEGLPSHIHRVTERMSRWYEVDVEGVLYKMPSVTTVLGKVWPKPALVNWFAKRGREAMAEYLRDYTGEPVTEGLLQDAVDEAKLAPKRDSDKAADLGTAAHELIAEKLQGKIYPVPSDLRHVMDAFDQWYKAEELELLDTECAIYSTQSLYAGTIDALFKRKNSSELLLVDFKTSKAVYPEMHVQLSAYSNAMREMAGRAGWDIPNIVAQVIRLGKEAAEFEVEQTPAAGLRALMQWHAAREFYNRLEAVQ